MKGQIKSLILTSTLNSPHLNLTPIHNNSSFNDPTSHIDSQISGTMIIPSVILNETPRDQIMSKLKLHNL